MRTRTPNLTAPGGLRAARLNHMAAAAPLRARGITVSRGPLLVLDAVDVTVAHGDTIGLVGPNGVGKSTLLRVLAGQLPPDRGQVELTPTTVDGRIPGAGAWRCPRRVDPRPPAPPHRRRGGNHGVALRC